MKSYAEMTEAERSDWVAGQRTYRSRPALPKTSQQTLTGLAKLWGTAPETLQAALVTLLGRLGRDEDLKRVTSCVTP